MSSLTTIRMQIEESLNKHLDPHPFLDNRNAQEILYDRRARQAIVEECIRILQTALAPNQREED